MVWHRTKYPAIRFREHPTRKHGIQADRYYVLTYKFEGKTKTEALGWASEGMTVELALEILAELKVNRRTGAGPQTLAEKKRLILEAKQAEIDRQRAEQERQEAERKANITFLEYFEGHYLPVQKMHKGRDTWIKELQHVMNWISPVIGNVPLKDVCAFHIERIKKALLDAGRTPRTIQYVFATFRQTWNHARRAGIVSGDSPTRSVKIPKLDNRRQRNLSPEECDALLEELGKRSVTTYRIALLSLGTGMRFGEIAKLQWQDVDLVRETIAVMDTKSGRNRTAYMTGRVKQMLAEMPRGEPDSLVFPGENGQRMREICKAFRHAVEAIGLNKGIDDSRLRCCFHSQRHTFASRLLEADVDLYRVKELLGHQNITTSERYSHVAADRLRSAIKDMERMNSTGKVISMKGRAG